MQRVRDIILAHTPLSPMASMDTAFSRFSEDPSLSVLAIVQDDRPVGLLERQFFLARFQEYSASSAGNIGVQSRSVANLRSRNPFVVDADMSVNALVELVLNERPEVLQDGFIAVDDDFAFVGAAGGREILAACQNNRAQHDDELTKTRQALRESERRAQSASNAKKTFVAMVGQEIRSPLNVILGLVDGLARTELSHKQAAMANTIRDAGEHLFRILNDVLDFSQIEAGKLSFEDRDFDVDQVLRETEAMWRPVAETKGLAFELSCGAGLMRFGRGDVVRIRQVIFNLLENAVQASERGKVHIHFESAPGPLLRGRVRDSGTPISDKERERIFKPFAQNDVLQSSDQNSSGLGLSIARSIVRLMGGQIGADALPDSGNEFWFELPLAHATTNLAQAPVVKPQRAGLSGLRILAAEDNRSNRLVLTTMLDAFGCEYVLVENGLEATRMAQAELFDVILMDVQMPLMDGLRATQMIRTQSGSCQNVPIIALTAHAGEEERRRCFAAGMNEHLEKPLNPSTVLAVIQAVLADPEQNRRDLNQNIAADRPWWLGAGSNRRPAGYESAALTI